MRLESSSKLIVLLALAFILSACATTDNISLAEKESTIAGYQLPSGPKENEAIVYIVRPDELGFAVRFKVFLDGKREEGKYVGYTRGVQYLSFPLSIGEHAIHSKAENWASVNLSVQDGDVIFLKQKPQLGLLFSGNSLEEITGLDGRYLVCP